jgi:hypothetical protein
MTSKFSQGDHVYLLDVNNPSLPHKRRGIRDYFKLAFVPFLYFLFQNDICF